MNQAPKTANATFCATLCDQLRADGLTAAFIAPGSRSTPLALALVAQPGISVEIFHDERAAAFAALGHGLATGRPALVLCSSGTAGAHFYAAVIEADAAAVPLIAVTADRPPELWGRGAPQTIDQTHLYGSRVRSFVEPGPPDDVDSTVWRSIARDLWTSATGPMPGPVHANLSFRDPLTGNADEMPAPIEPLPTPSTQEVNPHLLGQIQQQIDTAHGVIVAGRSEIPATDILQLAARLGWPVLADHRSGCRDPQSPSVVRHFDSLLRDPKFAESHRPDVVLRIGEIVTSKALSQWLTACAAQGTAVVASRPHGRHIDPENVAQLQFDEPGVLKQLLHQMGPGDGTTEWCQQWTSADRLAVDAIATVLARSGDLTEIGIAQAALASVPAGGVMVVSSSMPVRDVEWFGANRCDIQLHANRGANGIDGIISTAIGIALTGLPTVCLIGDVAFLHDATSLTALRLRSIDLTIVVTDNDGGGIFSFLPQHELLTHAEYEVLFGTPHGTNLAALAAAHGLNVEVFDAAALAPDGIRVVIGTTDRHTNLHVHNQLHTAVAAALDAAATT